ncbi:MAG: hypothetical protein LBK27_08270, partial [Treponema sp.]|nr:hypothetical protein [Treponema sp.]
ITYTNVGGGGGSNSILNKELGDWFIATAPFTWFRMKYAGVSATGILPGNVKKLTRFVKKFKTFLSLL